MHKYDYVQQDDMEHPFAFLTTANKDMVYFDQAIKVPGFKAYSTVPVVYCKDFEDNSGTLELTRVPKLRPQSKHINTTYHHFREHVRKDIIRVFPIGASDQLTDMYTKPQEQNLFLRHRKKILGF